MICNMCSEGGIVGKVVKRFGGIVFVCVFGWVVWLGW